MLKEDYTFLRRSTSKQFSSHTLKNLDKNYIKPYMTRVSHYVNNKLPIIWLRRMRNQIGTILRTYYLS